jgi:hypothetical protein
MFLLFRGHLRVRVKLFNDIRMDFSGNITSKVKSGWLGYGA